MKRIILGIILAGFGLFFSFGIFLLGCALIIFTKVERKIEYDNFFDEEDIDDLSHVRNGNQVIVRTHDGENLTAHIILITKRHVFCTDNWVFSIENTPNGTRLSNPDATLIKDDVIFC